MKRLANGTWELTDVEMEYISVLAYEASENYDRQDLRASGLNARRFRNDIQEQLEQSK